MAFMVDFVIKIGDFCSLISAGGALETTKLAGGDPRGAGGGAAPPKKNENP